MTIPSVAESAESIKRIGLQYPISVRLTDEPRIRKPRPQREFRAAYQAARREFFEEVAAVVGGGVLILDTDLKKICEHEIIVPPTQH